MSLSHQHISILVDEIINRLNLAENDLVVDATLGDGGHTSALLSRGVKVIAIDQDVDAISRAFERLKADHPDKHIAVGQQDLSSHDCLLIENNFQNLTSIVLKTGVNQVKGVLFDLGVSTHQLLEPSRGFSFQEGPLDMRMNKELSVTAADLVNGLGEKELTELFSTLGDEPRARTFASRIVKARSRRAITTTTELSDIIAHNSPRGRIHPATRVFQALRMAVNLEREALETSLPQAVDLLAKGGTLAVISFHSGEDGIVKRFINTRSDLKALTDKPLEPTKDEVDRNPRSRSARLRVAQKI